MSIIPTQALSVNGTLNMKFMIIFLLFLLHNQPAKCEYRPWRLLAQNLKGFANFVAAGMTEISSRLYQFLTSRADSSRSAKEKIMKDLITPDLIAELIEAKKKEIKDLVMKNLTQFMEFTTNLVKSQRKSLSVHKVYTQDGYQLILHRIQPSHHGVNRSVLLHHGLMGSSMDWILNGPKHSLPYLLSDAGFDVWLTNARGNNYSNKHVNLTVDSPKFWNFTWQDMGKYDLPAVIDYIRKTKSNGEKIDFIGYSMGASAFLVLLSTMPVYNDYMRMGILLAPLVYMSNTRGPLKVLSTVSVNTSEVVMNVLGKGMFLPQRTIPDAVRKHCVDAKFLCRNPLFFLCGGLGRPVLRTKQFASKLMIYLPASTSTRTILHFAQLIKSGKFHGYNEVNTEFSLKNVTLPIALFSSANDWIASVPDILKLYVKIKNPTHHTIFKNELVTHTGFMWGAASKSVFRKILETLENNRNNMTSINEV